MNNADRLGDKLGPRLAHLIADAMVDTHRRLTDHKIEVGAKAGERLLDLMGAEVAPFVSPLLQQIAGHPDVSPDVAAMLGWQATHRGESASAARFLLSTTGIGSGLGTVLNASMAPGIQHVLSLIGTALHDPGTAAQLAASGIITPDAAHDEARRQNLNDNRFDRLIEAAYNNLDPSTIFAMINRGLLQSDYGEMLLQRQGVRPNILSAVMKLSQQIISPADAADMVVRGIITPAEGQAIAAKSGYTAADFDLLTLDSGEPLAMEQLLLLYRRGQIDKTRLEHGIRQSRVRNEWIDVAVDLRFAPPSASDAIRAAVQNQLPESRAIQMFAEAGLDPVNFPWMLATAGRPPGIMEMAELWKRGYTGEAEVKQAIRESDIKNKYVDLLTRLAEYHPPVRQIIALLRNGAVTDAEASTMLAAQGANPALIQIELQSAHSTRTATARKLTDATIERLYHERAITRADAMTMLEAVGWSQVDADFLLEAQDLQRAAAAIEHTVSHVHTLYVSYRLDRPQTVAALAEVGLPAAQQTELLAAWDLERAAAQPHLSRAQIVAAFKWNLIAQTDALTRLQSLGYTGDDAALLLEIALHHPLGDAG